MHPDALWLPIDSPEIGGEPMDMDLSYEAQPCACVHEAAIGTEDGQAPKRQPLLQPNEV